MNNTVSAVVSKVDEVDKFDSINIADGLEAFTRPTVLRGFVNDWPAVKYAQQGNKAFVDYLQSFYQGQAVVLYHLAKENNGRIFYNSDYSGFNFESCHMPLDEVFKKLLDNEGEINPATYYVGSTTIDHCLPGFRRCNDVNIGKDSLVSLWLGNQTKVAAHFDAPHNLACCVSGRRRFTFFPTEQVKNLYVGPLDKTPSGQVISSVDISDPDFERYPLFREALQHALVAELEPGDAVYVPSMWWHAVESLSAFNTLVNYWWRDAPGFFGSPVNVMNHAILSIRDLPVREKQAWKVLFDHYVFDEQEGKYDHIPQQSRGALNPIDDTLGRRLRAWLLNQLNR